MLLSAAPAFGDPGAPGLDRASTSVYGNSGNPPKIGEQPPIPPGGDTVSPEQTSGGNPPPQNDLAGQNQGGGNGAGNGGGGGDESLPFTGFAAALVLGAGVLALLLGFTANAVARRPRRA